MTSRVIEAGVVACGWDLRSLQNLGELIHRLARGRIDHRQPVSAAKELNQRCFLLVVILRRHDVVGEIRPIKPGDDRQRILECELASDVSSHLGRRCGGERDGCRGAQGSMNFLDPQVAGTKVVAPLTDAVSLVNCE